MKGRIPESNLSAEQKIQKEIPTLSFFFFFVSSTDSPEDCAGKEDGDNIRGEQLSEETNLQSDVGKEKGQGRGRRRRRNMKGGMREKP